MTHTPKTPSEIARRLKDAIPRTYEAIDVAMRIRHDAMPTDERLRHNTQRMKDGLRNIVDTLMFKGISSVETLPPLVVQYITKSLSTTPSKKSSANPKDTEELQGYLTDIKLVFYYYGEQLGIGKQMAEAFRDLPDTRKGQTP